MGVRISPGGPLLKKRDIFLLGESMGKERESMSKEEEIRLEKAMKQAYSLKEQYDQKVEKDPDWGDVEPPTEILIGYTVAVISSLFNRFKIIPVEICPSIVDAVYIAYKKENFELEIEISNEINDSSENNEKVNVYGFYCSAFLTENFPGETDEDGNNKRETTISRLGCGIDHFDVAPLIEKFVNSSTK